MAQILLEEAHEQLNPMVSDWVFGGSAAAKKALLSEWEALPSPQKEAVAAQVRKLVPARLTVYRSVRHEGDLPLRGGASVTDDLKSRGRAYNTHAFEVAPNDIMLHYKMQESWLSSKAYAHEREIILRPDAKPRHLGPVTQASL